MGVLQRAAEIISANLNDAVDHFERPDRMLRQAMREMETLLAKTSTGVARSIAAERLLSNACAEEARQITVWKERAQTALATGNEERCRRAIAQQLNHQRSHESLNKQFVSAQAANEQLRRHLDNLKDKYALAKQKLTAIEASSAADAARCEFGTALAGSSASDRAVARFEYFYGKLERKNRELDARLDLERESLLDQEFAEQENLAEIEQVLEELRARR